MPKQPRNPELEAPGAEQLNPKDRELNLLGNQLSQLTHGLNAESYMLFETMADSEIPDSHTEIRTEVLHRLKERTAAITQIIEQIENTAGIIDTKPIRKELADGK